MSPSISSTTSPHSGGSPASGQSSTAASGTVTLWIEQLKAGDAAAAQKLWQRYFAQVVELARRRLAGAARGPADEEDVALSAFNSFCLGARDGKFPKLTDRNSLWSLLVAITAHKSVDQIRRDNRQKRGGAGSDGAKLDIQPLSEIIRNEPTPDFAALMAEQFDILIDRLDRADDADLLQIAIGKMSGESTAQIAESLGCVRRTVERKVQLIQRIWESECQ